MGLGLCGGWVLLGGWEGSSCSPPGHSICPGDWSSLFHFRNTSSCGLGAGQGCPRPLQFHATAGITCPLCHICQALITGMFHWTGFPASSCTCRQQIVVFAVRGMAFALLWGNLEVLTAPWVVKVGSPSWSPGWGKAHKSQACHTKITFPQAQMSHNSGFLPGCYPHWCPQQAKAFLHKQVAQGIQSPPELCH